MTLGNNVGSIWEEGSGALECSRVHHPVSGSLALLEFVYFVGIWAVLEFVV